MDEQTTTSTVLIVIWVFVNTVFTCAVVKYVVDKAERWLNNSIKCTERDVMAKFRDICYDLRRIEESLEELRDSPTPGGNEDTMVSISEVIATLEKMREV